MSDLFQLYLFNSNHELFIFVYKIKSLKKIGIIGGGFSGLSCAAVLAKEGYNVTIFEKNNDLGGRARQFKHDGYTFDMGPSWYWMSDVFDKFFKLFGKSTSDYFKLVKLDPGFKMVFNNSNSIDLPSDWESILTLFDEIEEGSSVKLKSFMDDAEFKYNFGINKLVYEPGISITELFKKDILKNLLKLNLFSSYRKHISNYFNHPYLRTLLEFPVLFLGTPPQRTPALYSLMAYSGVKEGTYYPIGGFSKVIDGFVKLCTDLGVRFEKGVNVEKINIENGLVNSISTSSGQFDVDYVVGSADYQHVDSVLIEKEYSNYNSSYWEKKTFSPSSLLFYLGLNKKINNLEHHNLFFDEDIEEHISQIYNDPVWPSKPLFYACCPSKTDSSVAPLGKENLFLLIPIAAGLRDDSKLYDMYLNRIITRIEKYTGENISKNIEFKRSYCISDFENDYNAYKGNAYGLANTLMQTANLKPKIVNKRVKNLFYTGQLTVPGPGVPPAIISGQVVANYILKQINS